MFRFISILVLIALVASAVSQDLKTDLMLIDKKDKVIVTKDNNNRSDSSINNKKPIIYRHHGIISKYNPFSLTATGAMLFYQNVVSPQFFSYCLYHRSCSNFSKKAIQEFGLIKGVFLSADRLMRCNIAAIQDFPPGDVSSDGRIIDEPSKYRMNSGKPKLQ